MQKRPKMKLEDYAKQFKRKQKRSVTCMRRMIHTVIRDKFPRRVNACEMHFLTTPNRYSLLKLQIEIW